MRHLPVVVVFLVPLLVESAREALTELFTNVFRTLTEPLNDAIRQLRQRRAKRGPSLWPSDASSRPDASRDRGLDGGQVIDEASAIWAAPMVRIICRAATAVVYLGLFAIMIITEYRLGAMRFASISRLNLTPEEAREITRGLENFGGLTLAAVPVTWAVFAGEVTGFVPWPTLFRSPRTVRQQRGPAGHDGSFAKLVKDIGALMLPTFAIVGLVVSFLLVGACWGLGQWATELSEERSNLVAIQQELQAEQMDATPQPDLEDRERELRRRTDRLEGDEAALRINQVRFQAVFGVLVAGALAISGVALLPTSAGLVAMATWPARCLVVPLLVGIWVVEFGTRGLKFGLEFSEKAIVESVGVVADIGKAERNVATSVARSVRGAARSLSAMRPGRTDKEDVSESSTEVAPGGNGSNPPPAPSDAGSSVH